LYPASDLFFGLGYAMAQDRLFQMDFYRHVAQGRLSEWFTNLPLGNGIRLVQMDMLLTCFELEARTRAGLEEIPDRERILLERFAAAQAAGKEPAELEYHEVVTEGGEKVFRYIKAIPMAQLCLQCHGTDIFLETQVNIQELYPEDQATGFAVGDIRGAFSVRRPL